MPKGHYERKKNIKKCAITYKDNFWSKKRVEQNVNVKEIALLLDAKYQTVSAYFTGQLVPHEDQIKTLCEYFDVDLIEGTREFHKAHRAYDATHKRTLVLSAKTKKKIEQAKKPEPSWEDEPTPIEKVAQEIKERQDKIFGAVYGKVSYREYTDLMEQVILDEGDFDLAKWLYNRVDYETFNSIIKSLEE